jgi:hypothetical protein
MMPDIEREERRKKRAPVIAFILFGMLVVAALVQLFQPDWQWVPLAACQGDETSPPSGVRSRNVSGITISVTGALFCHAVFRPLVAPCGEPRPSRSLTSKLRMVAY